MSSKLSKCPECSTTIKDDFLYCPRCKLSLKNDKIEQTMNGVSELISDTEPLTSNQMSIIHKIFLDKAPSDPTTAHLLEEKICHKFIRNISGAEYTVKDMIVISQKILALLRIQYSREY